MTALPRTFRDEIHSGGGDSFDRVGGGVPGVIGHVGGAGGVTRRARHGARRTFPDGPRGGMGGNGGGACRAAGYLAPRPGSRGFNGLARPVIGRVVCLEVAEHMFGAVGGPARQQPLVLLVSMFGGWRGGGFHCWNCAKLPDVEKNPPPTNA